MQTKENGGELLINAQVKREPIQLGQPVHVVSKKQKRHHDKEDRCDRLRYARAIAVGWTRIK